MNIQTEKLKACSRELNAIIVEYYEHTVAHEDVPPLDMDWEGNAALEALDGFLVITARDGTKLVGFVTYYIGPHPHHKTTIFATCGTLAVKLGWRGHGIAGKLLQAAERLLKMYHVKRISHGFRKVYDAEPIFPKYGYHLAELQFVKDI